MEIRMPRPITMLIADDSHITAQLLTDAARASKLPLRLSTTDNGRDCLTLLNGSNIDLAFIDVHMPELSGTEAFWSARKLGVQTFVTLMSSPPAAEAVAMAIKLRAYEFLFKPFALDDALAIIKTYARISSPNCEIAEAGDGETALTLAQGTQFDVVFLDCNMPGMSGIATMKRLALIQPRLKIVMISAERSATCETEALDGGACAFLHKPFNSPDVDHVLHAAFGLRSPNLKMNSTAPNFDVAIEGSTIRLAHRKSGHIFEYLWCEEPPYLRNAVVHAAACTMAPSHVAAVAEKTALLQLRSARLLAA
jgi:DNA-binding NtrC family response regulator